MSPDQRKVLGGMAGGAATAFGGLALAFAAAPAIGAALSRDRITALGCVLIAAPLAAGIARVAARRFFGPGIDGRSPPEDVTLDLDRRILTNTTEQTVLSALAFAALAAALPEDFVGATLVYAAAYAVARLVFAAGYRRGGIARAYGFAATFYMTLLALFVAAVSAIAG